jgi:pimeloyl-ACP methyl ester carboxylesterase
MSDASDVNPRHQKRTNGRLSLARAGLRVLAAVAPPLAERVAMDLFYRPRRHEQAPEVPAAEPHAWRVQTRAGRLAVWDYGRGPTVLLVHGWSGAAFQWSAFIGPLLGEGYNAIALDLPAHGRSDGERTNLQEFIHAVIDTAARVQPIRAVVGHSLGATAATLALAVGLRAERAVLIAPAARDVPGFVHAFARQLGLPAARERGLVARMRARFGDLDRFDARKAAATLRTPALVFHDVDDQAVPFAEGQALVGAWPGAQMRPLRGCGHNRSLKDPDVVRETLAFIADTAPLSPPTPVPAQGLESSTPTATPPHTLLPIEADSAASRGLEPGHVPNSDDVLNHPADRQMSS